MKLLLDENLSRRLVEALAARYPGSAHVTVCGLEAADDESVWKYAADNDFTVVTKDTDFHQRCFLYGAPLAAFASDPHAALLVLP